MFIIFATAVIMFIITKTHQTRGFALGVMLCFYA